jgi:outer membrane immunogenic protein
MTKLLMGSVALAAATMANVALAADMPLKAPILAPVVYYNWTGCYVGGNAGWKWGRFSESADVPSTTANLPGFGNVTAIADHINLDRLNADSGAAGGQIGCRWENPQHWVFGFEGDFDWTNLKGTVVNRAPGTGLTFVPGDIFANRANWESSARIIVGRSFDRWLVYGTGGIAFTRVTMEANFIPAIGILINGGPGLFPASFGSDSKILVGGTIGAGVAYALSKNWEIGAEYRFTAYQKGDFNLGTVAGQCGISTAVPGLQCVNQFATGHKDLQTQEILVKLNYKFDWAGPVVAKY